MPDELASPQQKSTLPQQETIPIYFKAKCFERCKPQSGYHFFPQQSTKTAKTSEQQELFARRGEQEQFITIEEVLLPLTTGYAPFNPPPNNC
ncbi:hypothetical protein E2C01_032677 [Portunus trituberculatus]|uniref:Uncharacterized protein n=1 Tax=Portunus trituberculatus TaxID=210409 RepID=A0A5B7F1C9_PORTR|nr:hypothetical protein [Portunus trituberculatus]